VIAFFSGGAFEQNITFSRLFVGLSTLGHEASLRSGRIRGHTLSLDGKMIHLKKTRKEGVLSGRT
jgi:hypothetical protein